jgi:hypothetical protein
VAVQDRIKRQFNRNHLPHKGQQYVSVASGLGGNVAKRFAADKVPTGGAMWTFALMPD